jgi:hypothetical protein
MKLEMYENIIIGLYNYLVKEFKNNYWCNVSYEVGKIREEVKSLSLYITFYDDGDDKDYTISKMYCVYTTPSRKDWIYKYMEFSGDRNSDRKVGRFIECYKTMVEEVAGLNAYALMEMFELFEKYWGELDG